MKIDPSALAIRVVLAFYVLTLVTLFLYLVGAAQSFLDQTQVELFQLVRWQTWLGLLGTWLLLVPASRRHVRRILASVSLGLGFGALFAFVLVWGSWIYPNAGSLSW